MAAKARRTGMIPSNPVRSSSAMANRLHPAMPSPRLTASFEQCRVDTKLLFDMRLEFKRPTDW
jgi:hypothetical protein